MQIQYSLPKLNLPQGQRRTELGINESIFTLLPKIKGYPKFCGVLLWIFTSSSLLSPLSTPSPVALKLGLLSPVISWMTKLPEARIDLSYIHRPDI